MNKFNNIALIVVVLLAILSLSLFTVYETDLAMILRFRKIRTEGDEQSILYKPGLHMKAPLIDDVVRFDMRSNIKDITASRITTIEKKDVWVDYYVLWRIEDIAQYYKRTQAVRSKAEALLEHKANAVLKIEIGQLTIKEVVSSARSQLMERLRVTTNNNADDLGIEVIDVRIKRIDLPKEVSDSVYTRMRAERQRIANTFRADGEKESITIRADADRRKAVILATAEQESKKLRGEGDAMALDIYAKSASKAPQFFEFYRSIEAYKQSFKDRNDILVLKPEGEFFKYFDSAGK